MEKSGLGERLKAKLRARRQRSTEHARMRKENRIEDNPPPGEEHQELTGGSAGV